MKLPSYSYPKLYYSPLTNLNYYLTPLPSLATARQTLIAASEVDYNVVAVMLMFELSALAMMIMWGGKYDFI